MDITQHPQLMPRPRGLTWVLDTDQVGLPGHPPCPTQIPRHPFRLPSAAESSPVDHITASSYALGPVRISQWEAQQETGSGEAELLTPWASPRMSLISAKGTVALGQPCTHRCHHRPGLAFLQPLPAGRGCVRLP